MEFIKNNPVKILCATSQALLHKASVGLKEDAGACTLLGIEAKIVAHGCTGFLL